MISHRLHVEIIYTGMGNPRGRLFFQCGFRMSYKYINFSKLIVRVCTYIDFGIIILYKYTEKIKIF